MWIDLILLVYSQQCLNDYVYVVHLESHGKVLPKFSLVSNSKHVDNNEITIHVIVGFRMG